MIYLATNLLNIPEGKFWRSTPRKLDALYEIYKEVNGLNPEKDANIDDIIF